MGKRIEKEMMENVEILAKLALSDEEREKAMKEMEKMLHYVEKLKELDTAQTEPMVHILPEVNVFREDRITNVDMRDELLANAPRQKEGQYLVPKTV